MALLWCDSMDGYGGADNAVPAPTGIVGDKYGGVTYESYWKNRVTGFSDAWNMQMSTYAYQFEMQTPDITTNLTMISGVNYYFYQGLDWTVREAWPLFRFANDSDEQCAKLVLQHAAGMYVVDADGLYLGSPRCHIDNTLNMFVEMKVYSHTTNGTIEVRVNGAPMFAATDVKTATANGAATRVSLGEAGVALSPQGFSRVDNFYVCDGSGSTNNDFLGRVTVAALFPDSDDEAGWAVTGNANIASNYGQVNSQLAKPGTDYVEEENTSAGTRDQYTMDDLATDYDTVHGVVAWAHAKYSTNAATIKFVVTSNGTEAESANVALTTGCTTYRFVLEEDPDTSAAWTPNTVNDVISGYEIV